MSPEAKKILLQVLRELIKHVEMPDNLSDFITFSAAERNGDTWTFYIDSNDRSVGVPGCAGNNEYEVKENIWSLLNACKNL